MTSNHPYAWGKFDAVYPDANSICHVSKVIGSNMTYPAYTSLGSGPPTPPAMVGATQVDYEWSNVKVYVKAPIIGSRIDADLTITEDMCTQSYHVNILFPRVPCAQLDSSGNPTDASNPSACSPNPNPVPNPKQSDLYGSGIAPGIDVSCQDIGVNMPGMHDWECLPTHPL
jgi:hypothetical protein